MPDSGHKFLVCKCPSCQGGIEFPSHGIGESIQCPHCSDWMHLSIARPVLRKPRRGRFRLSDLQLRPITGASVAECMYCSNRFYFQSSLLNMKRQCPCCEQETILEVAERRIITRCGGCGQEFSFSEHFDGQVDECMRCHEQIVHFADVSPVWVPPLPPPPERCSNCGSFDFYIHSPARPMLFTPLSISGILLQAFGSMAADAIFHDELRCSNCDNLIRNL